MASFNNLPLEILLEILYKLAVKQLHRNKIVCKLWLSLISRPSFRSEYSIRRNSSSFHAIKQSLTIYLFFPEKWYKSYGEHLAYDEESMSWSKDGPGFSLEFLPDINIVGGIKLQYNIVLASSNGLLLCSTRCYGFRDFYYVCNPLTKQWSTLPSPPTPGRYALWGFVYNPSYESENGSSRFKVVKTVSPDDNKAILKVFNMEIFESATNQWRVLTTTLDAKINFGEKYITFNAVEHRGILYWRCTQVCDSIIEFDPNLDLCREISLPRYLHCLFSVFGVSQDHLYYVEISSHNSRIFRYDEFEGEYTWRVHARFSMNFIDQLQHVYPQDLFHFNKILAIDPMDCNVLYLSSTDQVSRIRHILSLHLGRGEMSKLCYFPRIYVHDGAIRSLMFVQPSWPTSVPRLPPRIEPRESQEGLEHPLVSRKRGSK